MELIISLLFIVAIVAIYFLPSLIAQGKENENSITLLNLLTGWSGIGWIACFIWACVSPKRIGGN